MNRCLLATAALALMLPSAALAQIFVVPRRAERSAVKNFDFDWRHVDILVGPQAEGEAEAPKHTAHSQSPAQRQAATPAPGAQAGDAPLAGASTPVASAPQTPPAASPDGGTVTPGPEANAAASATLAALRTAADGGMALPEPEPVPTYATSLGAATGGVRFYFYEREREVAERAAPVIEEAYRYLVDSFKYVPTKTFPYILYSSYAEFLQTNAFAVSEGTLGVTSTQGDLKLSLPYLGDHKLFEEVSTHELAHQFTIQKVRTLSGGERAFGDPLSAIPLWFIEGLAEFYAKRGLDPETEMLARDLLVNPDLMRGYAFLDFFSPGPYGFLWIYKVGQMRVAFLEEEYGAGFIQKVLENSPRLVGAAPGSSSMPFEMLLQQLTGDDPKKISARFENWMKRRAFKSYLASAQSAPVMEMLQEREGIITAMASSPDGHLVMYRTIIPETGESRLYMLDPREPERTVKVVGDGAPGYESLHPISGRNFALAQDKLVFVAESLARDVLYVQQYTHQAQQRPREVLARTRPMRTEVRTEAGLRVKLSLGSRTAYTLGEHGLLAAYSPAFSPDGKQVAFIGINDKGVRDVYVLDLAQGEDAVPQRITHDVFSERQLSWGPTGIIFTSDATSHRRYNLFRVRPEAPDAVERLTSQELDEADPLHLPDGRIFFVAYTHKSSDLHELLADGRIVRRTDVPTGVFEPGPGPDGALWMLFHHAGEKRPSTLKPEKMLALQVDSVPPPRPPSPLARRTLTEAEHYRPFTLENLDIGPFMGFAGAGGGFLVGQLFGSATDRLRNHVFLLNMAVYGSPELTDGYLLYINQEKRVTWGTGLFQSLRFRVDSSLPETDFLFSSGERFYGAMGTARYPLSTFFYLQGELSLGGTGYFLNDFTEFLLYTDASRDLLSLWRERNGQGRFQTELSAQVGYNSIRYHYATGPLQGSSVLLDTTVATQPLNGEVFGNVRLDAERYFPVMGRTNLAVRASTGSTFGGRFARSYFLYSFDTLRGVNFGDQDWLLGRNFFFSNMELQVPLNDIIRVAFLGDVEGVVGVDFGGVGDSMRGMWDRRVLDFAVGANVMLGPMLLRLHFAKPFDVGSRFGKPDQDWVTNFSLGFAGGPGFFSGKGERQPAARKPMPMGFGPGRAPNFP